MYDGKSIAIVLPAYNEAENIELAVRDFLDVEVVDKVYVVDNNSSDRTAELARKAGAVVLKETRQGYGWALRRGLQEADADYIILSEPDGTFVATTYGHWTPGEEPYIVSVRFTLDELDAKLREAGAESR